MSKYYSIHEFSKIIGVSAQTLRNWDANGKLHPHHTTVSGYKYYSDLLKIWFKSSQYSAVNYKAKRANKARKLIRELIQEETDGKSHKSNVDTKQCTEN